MLSVRPKVAELSFHVFGRPVHPELYRVHNSRRMTRDHYTATIDITDCGHVVTWQTDRGCICEVAASSLQPLPTRRCRLSKRLRGSRTEHIRDDRGISYRTHFQLETVKPDLFWMMHKQLGQGPTKGLLHQFDSSGRISFGALSYINIETRLRSMLVQAVHTFPDDYAIVKVESLFNLPNKLKKTPLD
ncbi:MAG: DUF2617 family protein [Planctomycetota bacterium]